MVALALDCLTRHFGGLTAVNNVSLQIQPGEIFGLIGPNGAGKTTLFNLVTGLIEPSSGTVTYADRSITSLSPDRIAHQGIARTFQNLRLFGQLSALENVMVARHRHSPIGLWPQLLHSPAARAQEQAIRDRASALLHLVGLSAQAQQQANTLAYGDQRRLEIARALALDPQLLLLDEPAAGMNPTEKGQLSDLIRQIQDQFKLTVLLIEHHVPLVMGLCDRIAVLDFGELIAIGSPDEVKADPRVIEAYLGSS